MNIFEAQVKHIRPAPNGQRILGVVSFFISSGPGKRCDIVSYDCSCAIPVGDTSRERMALIKLGLKKDAIRQARQMPEIRSKNETFDLLAPSDQAAA